MAQISSAFRPVRFGVNNFSTASLTQSKTAPKWQHDDICLRFSGEVPKKFSWAKTLGIGLLGITSLFSAGCNNDVRNMEEKLQTIPAVQVEQRADYLVKQAVTHANENVRVKALEHLVRENITPEKKVSTLLSSLADPKVSVMQQAQKGLRQVADDNEVPASVQSSLRSAADNFPWTENYTESHTEWTFHYGYNMFSGDYEFHYGPETKYEQKQRSHGNAEAFQKAASSIQKWLNQ